MGFIQAPPRLGNQYDDDALLRSYLARTLPPELHRSIEPDLRELGELSGGHFAEMQVRDRLIDPKLEQWDAWGNRIDRVEVSPLWKEAERLSATHGLVAVAYERRNGPLSRVHQFALNYVVQASLDIYSCPLAMTDGAALTLLQHRNQKLIDRALPHLLSRDPKTFWTSGQWMTERTGGSDVGLSETVARQSPEGWRLYGDKWFTSGIQGQVALTLGRPEGNGPGGKGLALFYVELHDAQGRLNGITIHRLKDKLGTRKVPTAEISLDGTLAEPVLGLDNGVRNITPMLNITRTWNAMGAAWGLRRATVLSRDYARRRSQFGALLQDKPLHVDTLAWMEAEFAAGFLLAFRAVELLGQVDHGGASEQDELLQRIVTPLAKLTTGKQVVAVASEALECIGGSGYVEDTGLPLLLRDAQTLPIWEGTTNVLSLDTLRALKKAGTLEALGEDVRRRLSTARDPSLRACVETAEKASAHAQSWLVENLSDLSRVEAGARRFALTLGRTLELALLVEHAQWCLDHGFGPRTAAAARRFALNGVDLLAPVDAADSRELAG